jgi:hypothetical protein
MPAKRLVTGSLAVLAAAASVATLSAAPDTRPPRIVTAAMQDTDRDGRADRLRLTYSERVRHRADRDGRYPFQVAGYRIERVGHASGRTVVLELVEPVAADGVARPSLRYRRTSDRPVLDRAGNQAPAQVFPAVRAHGSPPDGPAGPQQPAPPTGPARTDNDADGTPNEQDCQPDNPNVHPNAPDRPDLGFVDANCDGIDGDERKAIFVSPLGNDMNPGTRARPKRQIDAAIAAAPVGTDVYAAAGAYQRVRLKTGVDVYGGYDAATWKRSLTLVTQITGVPEAVYAFGDTGVVLQLLAVQGTSGGQPGASAYGIRAINGSSLTLQRVTVLAGNGSPGSDGSPGAAGEQGGRGGRGVRGACDTLVRALGGVGGFSPAGRTGGNGGSGVYEDAGKRGEPGLLGTPGGFAGAPSWGSAGSGGPGGDGKDGASGAPGAAGAGGTDSTMLASNTWQGQPGTPGGSGAPGNGGGGGGAGGGQTGWIRLNGTGNGGGGGGGGGAGGQGGTGGTAAGGSFGVYLRDSTVTVSDGSSIAAGDGGAGGRGGSGGVPGPGGPGGLGETHCTDEVGAGGDGGHGGAGGRGGGGGGGAGGPSVGIFKVGTSSATVVGSTIATGRPGPGGPGGPGNGGAGATGIAQAIYPA